MVSLLGYVTLNVRSICSVIWYSGSLWITFTISTCAIETNAGAIAVKNWIHEQLLHFMCIQMERICK